MFDDSEFEDPEFDDLQCIDCNTTVNVSLEYPGYGNKSYPRCQSCGEKRREREKGNIERNLCRGPTETSGKFDSADAGEYFDESEYS